MVIVEVPMLPCPRVTLNGENDRVGFEGVAVPERLIVPANPLTLVRVMPTLNVEETGVATKIAEVAMVKSGDPAGITVTDVVWNVEPLVALTVTVN